MGETSDFSRRRLAEFLAARLKARQREKSPPQSAGRDSSPTVACHLEQKPEHTPNKSDSISR